MRDIIMTIGIMKDQSKEILDYLKSQGFNMQDNLGGEIKDLSFSSIKKLQKEVYKLQSPSRKLISYSPMNFMKAVNHAEKMSPFKFFGSDIKVIPK